MITFIDIDIILRIYVDFIHVSLFFSKNILFSFHNAIVQQSQAINVFILMSRYYSAQAYYIKIIYHSHQN